ncbi:VanZ family protein [Shouchella lonarensis]|uniref:VanZ like family protein n=1 Tax=Shouchella lonarensis TaxID=1464122 RepID=A0A1G6HX80_9BACI|nr:VanZ family protein [Shouchella lonarensis]SDB98821.1 VanZ like family protein [Shouchella lonarensis]
MEQLWYSFSDVIPIFTVMIPFVLGISWLHFKRQRKKGLSHREAFFFSSTGALFILSIIGILLVTLLPIYGMRSQTLQLKPFSSILHLLEYSITASVTIRLIGFNMILFMPFGLFFSLRFHRKMSVWTITFLGMLFSTGIETAQYVLAIGRTSNIDDVILNTTGTFIGALIGLLISKLFFKKTRKKSIRNK